jgi:hypothetical protein
MKMRLIQKPSLTGNPEVHWYHAQVKRFGFWVDCRDDLFMMMRFSSEMMSQSYDTNMGRVESFVEYAMRGEDMFPKSKTKIIKEYSE